jgi:hypothetical protein
MEMILCWSLLEWNEWTKEGAALGLVFSVPFFFYRRKTSETLDHSS